MTRRAIYLAAAVAVLVSPLRALGQTQSDAQKTSYQREAVRMSIQQPTADAALLVPRPQFTLLAEKGKQKVTGTFGIGVENWSADFSFSGPIGEEDAEASPLSLGGLNNGSSVRFGFSYGTVSSVSVNAEREAIINEICQRQLDPDDCDTSSMTPGDRALFIRQFLPRYTLLWGVHLTLNRQKFTYSADGGLTDATLSHTNQGVTGSVGVLTSGLWFFGGHVEKQKARKAAGKPAEFCVATSTAGVERCRTTTLGEPLGEATATLLTLEARRIFVGSNIGINPRFVADLDNDVETYELPIYFLREAADAAKNPVPALNGGVSIGWHSKEGAVVRAFVGVAFGLVSIR